MTTQAFRPLKTKAATTLASTAKASASTLQQQQQEKQATVQQQQQAQITSQQSLSVVRTMLTVSFGCIAYLRGLLPEENFSDNSTTHTLAADLRASSTAAGSAPSASQEGKQEKGALKVKTVKRNYSPEGDKLMDYLEKGVMDAIEKQYLRALVMSIYMNPDDPANVIETYTFNFSYPSLPDGTTIPVLSVTSNLKDVHLGEEQKSNGLLDAAREGGMTVGVVKKAVRHMIKQLILLTQNLADLPRKRCLSFKAFYMEHTPEDYHPPMFREADLDKERLYFATRSRTQAPEISKISEVNTGHHGVQLTIRSIADLLPASDSAGDSLPYGEVPVGKSARELEDAMRRDDEALERDGEKRKYLWNAEEEVWDGREEEADLDVLNSPPSPPVFNTSFAVRTSHDTIEVISKAQRRRELKGKKRADDGAEEDVEGLGSLPGDRELENVLVHKGALMDETQPVGAYEEVIDNHESASGHQDAAMVETHVEDDSIGSFSTRVGYGASQAMDVDHIDATQPSPRPSPSLGDPFDPNSLGASLQPSFQPAQGPAPAPSPKAVRSRKQKTQASLLAELGIQSEEQLSSLVALPPRRSAAATAASAAMPSSAVATLDLHDAPAPKPTSRSHKAKARGAVYVAPEPTGKSERGQSKLPQAVSEVMEGAGKGGSEPGWMPCWCGDHADGLDMVACDGPNCQRYMHIWCVGGKSPNDFAPNEPFFCPDCRLRADPRTQNWSQECFDECMRSFMELALFRRALRIAFDETLPATLTALAKRLHCSLADAKVVFERLQSEGFLKVVKSRSHKAGKRTTKDHYIVDRSREADAGAYFVRGTEGKEDELFGLLKVEADADLKQRSRVPSALSDAPDEPSLPRAAPSFLQKLQHAQAASDDDDESQTQTEPQTYQPALLAAPPLLQPIAALSESIRSASFTQSLNGGETQMLPPPPPHQPPLTPLMRHGSIPLVAHDTRTQGAGSKGKKTLARAFEQEEAGTRRTRMRVGMARSGLDLTT